MAPIMQSQIFFFISSVGFIILGIMLGIVLIRILKIIDLFSKILVKTEKDIDSIGSTAKEMFEDIHDSIVFKFLFKSKKKNKKIIN